MEIWSKSCRLACHRMDPRYSDHASEISSFPFHLFIRRPFLFYLLAGVFSVSVPRPFPKLRGRLSSVFIRRSEGRLLERIKPIHTLNLSTASHPATWCTSRIKRCYVNMEKVVDSCMRRTWISLSCPTSRETDAFVSLASPLSLSLARIVPWYACVTFSYICSPHRLFVSNESWISIRRTIRTFAAAINQS